MHDSPARLSLCSADTDSIFVEMPGRTIEEAFRIGNEIATAVTASMPAPMKLQLEKIYLPCILFAKKRYAGMMFERPPTATYTPKFDAKGIETVRRDGCQIVRRTLESVLRALFTYSLPSPVRTATTATISRETLHATRRCVEHEWRRILSGKASVGDVTFWKEVRIGSYSRPPPAAMVAARRMARDRRAAPLMKERVPYVVLTGPPGTPYSHLVAHPMELLERDDDRGILVRAVSSGQRLNSAYYIENALMPPLKRVFSLIDVDVEQWYREMPRVISVETTRARVAGMIRPRGKRRSTIDGYCLTFSCVVCAKLTRDALCDSCKRSATHLQASAAAIVLARSTAERDLENIIAHCKRCAGDRSWGEESHQDAFACERLSCPSLDRRVEVATDYRHYSDICRFVAQKEAGGGFVYSPKGGPD